jgi:hypothetical protein
VQRSQLTRFENFLVQPRAVAFARQQPLSSLFSGPIAQRLEQGTHNCLTSFCAGFRRVAQRVFHRFNDAPQCARGFAMLRSFALRKSRTVENDREFACAGRGARNPPPRARVLLGKATSLARRACACPPLPAATSINCLAHRRSCGLWTEASGVAHFAADQWRSSSS